VQTPEDAEDGPPELLFVHAGQSTKLNDIAWNANDDWVMATVSEDNNLQVRSLPHSVHRQPGVFRWLTQLRCAGPQMLGRPMAMVNVVTHCAAKWSEECDTVTTAPLLLCCMCRCGR
jgi:hypothetical protein